MVILGFTCHQANDASLSTTSNNIPANYGHQLNTLFFLWIVEVGLVLAVHAPGHMFRGTNWKIAVYLDKKADNHQKYALTKLYTGQVGGEFFAEILPRIGEILRIKSVPIEFSIEGKKRLKIKIPFITEMEIEWLAGRDPDNRIKSCQSIFFKYSWL
jgi:hypothetical protein